MERINQNTLLNIQQDQLIEKHYPAFSDEIKKLRKKWNKIHKTTPIPWELYLLYRSIDKEYF